MKGSVPNEIQKEAQNFRWGCRGSNYTRRGKRNIAIRRKSIFSDTG
jgi:hypothetical protein